MKNLILIIIIIVMVQGCSYPASQVRIPDKRPSIAVENAPDGAILFVDGLNMGPANQYNGHDKALLIEPGTHKIEVVNQGRTILSEKIFLGGSELKIFRVHNEAK
jgi:hypothetical protein